MGKHEMSEPVILAIIGSISVILSTIGGVIGSFFMLKATRRKEVANALEKEALAKKESATANSIGIDAAIRLIEELQQQNTIRQSELLDLSKEVLLLRRELNQIKVENMNLKHEQETRDREKAEEHKAWEREKAILTAKVEELTQIVEGLRSENLKLKAELEELRNGNHKE